MLDEKVAKFINGSNRVKHKAEIRLLKDLAVDHQCTVTKARERLKELDEDERNLRLAMCKTYLVPSSERIQLILYDMANAMNARGIPARVEGRKITVGKKEIMFFTGEPLFCMMEDGESSVMPGLDLIKELLGVSHE